jgi:hypothetical protein
MAICMERFSSICLSFSCGVCGSLKVLARILGQSELTFLLIHQALRMQSKIFDLTMHWVFRLHGHLYTINLSTEVIWDEILSYQVSKTTGLIDP